MFRVLMSLVIACSLAPATFGQAEWNRRISDVRIVHPPGTPPGTWRATVGLDILEGPNTPQPASLSLDLTCSINGMPFVTEGIEVTPLLVPNACFFQCPSTVCNQLSLTSLASGVGVPFLDAFCYDPPGPQYACNCWLHGYYWNFYYDLVLQPSDTLQFDIAARAGSLPEIDTSDDTFSIHVWEQAPGVEYCFGNGPLALCPCGNSGAVGNGCANSVNPNGGNLLAAGNGSVSNDTVVLNGSGMPNSTVLYFQGTAQTNGGNGTAFGDGLRCAGGAVIRLRTKINVGGASAYPEPGDPAVSVQGAVPPAGGTRTYQGWYRNAAAYCTTSTFNLTNGVSIAWQL